MNKADKQTLITKTAICTVFLVGLLIRVAAAAAFSFWLDEAAMFFTSRYNVTDLLLLQHWNVSHPPLYLLFLHFWQMLGSSEIFLRLPSLLFSGVTLYVSYIIGCRLKNRVFGLILLSIFAFSNYLISFSWQANTYALAVMLALLTVYYYFFRTENLYSAVILIILMLAGMFSDYGFVWLIFSLIIFELSVYFLTYRKINNYFKARRFHLFSLIFSSAVVVAWGIYYVPKLPEALTLISWLPSGNLLLKSLNDFIRISYSFDLKTLLLLTASISGIYAGFSLKSRINKSFVIFILISITFPLATAYAYSLFQQPVLISRHFFVSGLGLLFGLAYFVYYSRKLWAVPVIVVYLLAGLSGLPGLGKLGVDDFNWKKSAHIITEYEEMHTSELNFFIDAGNNRHFFRTLRYYLELEGNNTPDMVIPKDNHELNQIIHATADRKNFRLWYFDFKGSGKNLTIPPSFLCTDIREYTVGEDTRFLNCKLTLVNSP
ncbi:MAG: hypothetical protein UV73_C0002G0152 [Candidatus Gottesmanbacteria bacterium GW2011_GWA2_43_14]|uniref:Uncharacterized protein n=1 Tax=Candidatus Gottesmanbacteria bacterium GW2011_GWA2_43_14 TaxID=1618443 RepID=A0A0G1GI21_9BACT|nr:MAG: hypothetical protein UV73_C0002G0152 [Candidatus Gottesmanbacteria bacterium GW2011_GWA2_43_14]